MAESKNHMGLDKFQITVIKSNFTCTKPIRKMIEKNEAKIQAAQEKRNAAIKAAEDKYEETVKNLVAETQAYKNQIETIDTSTKNITQQACGIALSSEEAIKFLDKPVDFAAFKQGKLGVDMFSEGQSEAKEPADTEPSVPNDAEDLPFNGD